MAEVLTWDPLISRGCCAISQGPGTDIVLLSELGETPWGLTFPLRTPGVRSSTGENVEVREPSAQSGSNSLL